MRDRSATAPPSADALTLMALSKSFGATLALDRVDLSIRRGEVVALLGANGAGKSTLAKIAAGVHQPDRGSILVGGRSVRFASPREARLSGVVTVHQATDQLGVAGMSAAENLALDSLCGGGFGLVAGPRGIARKAAEIAAHIGLDIPLDRDFGTLGAAQRQLIAIARAAASQASVLILDEPTASLGAVEARGLFQVVDRLRASGVGVLYISHRMSDIRRLADRVVVMRNGGVVHEQARPYDLALAIRRMIGRELDSGARAAANGDVGAPILELRGVRLRAGARPFDLDVRAGEIVAITGALGVGKSRLLRGLFGVETFAAGRVTLDGASWRPRGPGEAIARGVFMAGEERWRSSLLPPLTLGGDIAGTIALPHRRKWFPFGVVARRRENAAARRAIVDLGIRCRGPADTLDQLSGGNQQKVVVGRWRAEPCRLLLVDEPFQGVDIGARHDIVDAIRQGQRKGATLLVTSDVEEALEAADRVAVARDHTLVSMHDLRKEGPESLLASLSAIESEEASGLRGAVDREPEHDRRGK